MKSIFINILIGIALVYGGYYLLENSGKFVSQEDFDEVENLCTYSESTLGILQETVTETTMTIRSVDITSYELSYLYKVAEQEFFAKKTVSNIDTFINPISKVWYNKEQPNSNSLEEPCEKWEVYQTKYAVGSQMYFFIPGTLMGLVGLNILWNMLKTLLIGLWKKESPHNDWI